MAVGTTTAVPVEAPRQAAPSLGQRLRQPAYWQGIRFLVFGRALPAMLFAWMGYVQVGHLQGNLARLGADPSLVRVVTGVVPNALYLAFCTIPVGIYLTRPAPRRRDGRLVARAAAFTGTLMQLVVGAFLPVGPTLVQFPGALRDLATPLAITAFSLAVLSLGHLRRNLSIIPEARRLTTSGPYRYVRHPLYSAEILAAVAVVLGSPAAVPVAALLLFVAVQNLRASFEERLLLATFPEYAAYRERTRRLIPFVW